MESCGSPTRSSSTGVIAGRHDLRDAGVRKGDRVAYIARNTHANLEAFYAVPMLGAVLVPLNYRLTADDFQYLITHSGACVVCADRDYLDAVDAIRPRLPAVRTFVALDGVREGWLDYDRALAATEPIAAPEPVDERDLLTINYTSGTTSRPKGVMITHRNAWMNSIGTLIHVPMTPPIGISGRCRCSTPMDGRSCGRSPRSAPRTCAFARSIPPRCSRRSEGSASRRCARPPRC